MTSRSPRLDDTRRLMAIGLAVAVAYVTAAELGFVVAFAAEQVTTVWAPTGIGLAALLIWGLRLWPAIWIGAFVANAGSDAPLWTAAAVATGNTLEAVAATWALRRIPRFDPGLSRIRDVLAFTTVGAGLSTTLSATIGVTALCAGGVQSWSRFPELWSDWWLGDAIGALVVAPAILTFARRMRWTRREWLDAALMVGGVVIATHFVFRQRFEAAGVDRPFEYVIFPFVIAAAVRGGPSLTALVVLGASAVTIWHTVQAAGPFAGPDVHQSLILLQTFMGVLAGTGLLLAAAMAERRTGERRRTAAFAVGEVLAGAHTLSDGVPALLRSIGRSLEWQFGALWLVDPGDDCLRCLTVWSDDEGRTAPFAEVTRTITFARGVGLPGRVWATDRPAWIEDVVRDANFPRAPVARETGLHGGFAFPIFVDSAVVGVIECFNRTAAAPDPDLLQVMSTVGHQIGQFMARRREEAAALQAQRRTAAILETALDAVIGMDHRGRITEFNPAAVRTFGYARTEAIGHDLADLLIPPALRAAHRQGLARYLATGVGRFVDRRVETVGYHADGREFPVEIAIIRATSDHPPVFTGFVRDLTARMHAERERDELLGREAAARSEAEAANRAKDEFLATLSHELRTPLNVILGWTRMLLDGTLDGPSTRRALEVIDRNAHLQAQLVADILDVSRIITGGLRLDVQPVDLGTIVGAALDAVGPAADARKVRLRSRLPAAARLARGDPQRLQQIVWNLLANAVKFTEAGGTVTIELIDAGARGIQIRVQDDGAGIEPGFLPHVFERFRQADGSVGRQHGGLGLGLAIVRHLVELHGGMVRAESPGLGLGSTFTVELPRLEPETALTVPSARGDLAGIAPPEAAAGTPLAGYRLLVVDDQEDARDLIAAILTSAGAEVDLASSVPEALGRIESDCPDVLLADIGMPGADGYALIREVRALDAQRGRHLPAAAITAYAGETDRARLLAAGFDCHVSKPISRAAVIDAVLSISPDDVQERASRSARS